MRRAINGSLSESDYLNMVIGLAHYYNWRVAHFRPAMTSKGWRTPVQGDAAGFPDLALVRGNRDKTASLIFLEVKREKGKLTPAQRAWLSLLNDVPGITAKACYPSDWELTVDMLK